MFRDAAYCLLSVIFGLGSGFAETVAISAPPSPESSLPIVESWRTVVLDPEFGGQWLTAGDLDGDGVPEIVSAENVNVGDVHYTSSVAVQRMDGTLAWKWGEGDAGRKNWHHDVACQIHDWDGDGNQEVVVCTRDALVELDGKTGAERRRIALPEGATDCLVFCDVSGIGRATDVLVKNRYEQVWMYDRSGNLLWTVAHPGGYRTAHQPIPMDLDGDSRDEVLAGYALLNSDGSVRWVYASDKVDLVRGHLDCARILERGPNPADWRIAMTFCGSNALVISDGNGQPLWEMGGFHFESINLGNLDNDLQGDEIAVDIDHQPMGDSPVWFVGGNGVRLGKVVTPYSRHHKLVDWTGDGVCELVVAHTHSLYSLSGEPVTQLAVPDDVIAEAGGAELSVLLGDMTGDGSPDILLVTPTRLFIYKNPVGATSGAKSVPGTGLNVTLY